MCPHICSIDHLHQARILNSIVSAIATAFIAVFNCIGDVSFVECCLCLCSRLVDSTLVPPCRLIGALLPLWRWSQENSKGLMWPTPVAERRLCVLQHQQYCACLIPRELLHGPATQHFSAQHYLKIVDRPTVSQDRSIYIHDLARAFLHDDRR